MLAIAGLDAVQDQFVPVSIDLTADVVCTFDLVAMRAAGAEIKQVGCAMAMVNGAIGSIVVAVEIGIGGVWREATTLATGNLSRSGVDVSEVDAIRYRVKTAGSSGERGIIATAASSCCP